MTSGSLTFLCTGDIHIGRHPSRVPDYLDSSAFSPGAMWGDVVEYAITNEVDGVIVSGDVIDEENEYFEAFGPFEEGAKRTRYRENSNVCCGWQP